MRAARLLTMVLALQRRGRTTAQELAELLEVSPRTVLRDVEALVEAGLPVVTSRGFGGGIALLGGVRGLAAELSRQDAEALSLIGFPALADALGLGTPVRAARAAVDAALPPPVSAATSSVGDWLVVALPGTPDDGASVRLVARAVREQLEISVAGDRGRRRVLGPLALVLAGDRWVLLHRRRSSDRVRAADVAGLGDVRLLGTAVERPPGFDPAAVWAALGGR